MKVEFTLDEVVPELREVISFVEKKCMYNLVVTLPDNINPGQTHSEIIKSHRVYIKDQRFPHMKEVASIGFHSREGKSFYQVWSHLIQNNKYRAHSRDFYTKKAADMIKAAKILLDVCKPLTFADAMEYNMDKINLTISAWREETYRASRLGDVLGYGVDEKVVFKEVENMVKFGIPFATEKFKKVATETYPAYLEYNRRRAIKFDRYHVYYLDDGRVAVSKLSEEQVLPERPITTEMYPSTEAIPEPILGKLALLKMLGEDDKRILGIGARVSDREYYTLEEITPQVTSQATTQEIPF